jgi:putative flippase GtrA
MGFFLMKFVVFTESNTRGRVQLFRYFMVFVSSLVLNYFCLKLFVEYLHIFVMLSQIMTTVIIILFSYLFQKHFTFKVKFHNEEAAKN